MQSPEILRNAFVIPSRSVMSGERIQPLKSLKPSQHITVIGGKAGQAQAIKTARITRPQI